MKTIAGVFTAQPPAHQALQELQAAGFDLQRVSVIARDPERARDVAEDTGAEVRTGAATGAGVGAVLGASGACSSGSARWRSPASGPWSPPGPLRRP